MSNDSVLVDSSWLQLAGFGVNPTEFGLSTAVNLLQEEVQKREEGGRKAGRRRPGRLAGHRPVKKSSYVGDFTESGRVARAARVLGFRVIFKVQSDIREGLFAPPNLTFAVACDREGVLRTKSEPWGCQTLSEEAWEQVKDDDL